MTQRRTHLFLAGSLGLLITLLSFSAAADSPIDKEAALDSDFDSLVTKAQQAYQSDDFQAAAEYLKVAYFLDPEPRLLINIARSYNQMGHCELSLAYYQAFLDNPPDDDGLIAMVGENIEEESQDCAAYDPDLSGRITLHSRPPLAQVYLDGELLDLTPTETVGLEAGTYELRFELDGYETHEEVIEVSPSERVDVVAELREPEPEPEEPEPTVTEDDLPSFSLNPGAVTLGGLGVASLVTSGIFNFILIPGVDDDREAAADDGDFDRVDELTDKRSTYSGVTIATGITAAALIGGAAAWIGYDYYRYSSERDAVQREIDLAWQITPQFDRHTRGISIFRRF